MNQSFCAAFTWGCWGMIVSIGMAASSANGALTSIGNAFDHTNEPNLIGTNSYPDNLNPSVIETLYGEHNVRRIDDAFDTLFTFTEEEATFRVVAQFSSGPFLMSGGLPRYKGDGVTILRLPEYVGAPGHVGYDFPEPYESVITRSSFREPVFPLALSSIFKLVWSDPGLNSIGGDRLVTFEVVGNEGRSNNPIGSLVLCWEDQELPFSDFDFQDLVIEVSGIAPAVPEPSSVVMGTLAALGAFVWCLRRTRLHRLASP